VNRYVRGYLDWLTEGGSKELSFESRAEHPFEPRLYRDRAPISAGFLILTAGHWLRRVAGLRAGNREAMNLAQDAFDVLQRVKGYPR